MAFLSSLFEWTLKNELIFLMKNQVHCYITGNSNTFYLFLFPSRANIRLFGSYFSVHELSHLKSLYFVLLVMGYSRKNSHPHDGRHGFLTPPSTWISKTAWAPLHSGFPSSKTPAPIWISIKLLDTVILLYTQCRRILVGT